MYIGLAGRVSVQGTEAFLMTNAFLAQLRQHFAPLAFSGFPDGLVITLDSFPNDGPLKEEVKPVRKLRNPTVRNEAGSLIRLPSLHSAGIALNHSKLVACKSPRDVALLIAAELERQAPQVFPRLGASERSAFCSEFRAAASAASARRPRPLPRATVGLWSGRDA